MNRTIHRNRPIILVCVLCAVLLLMTACISVSSSKPERILEVELIAPGLKINQGNVFDLQLVLSNSGLYNVHIVRIVLPK